VGVLTDYAFGRSDIVPSISWDNWC